MSERKGSRRGFSRRTFLATAAAAGALLAARIAALPAWRPLLDEDASAAPAGNAPTVADRLAPTAAPAGPPGAAASASAPSQLPSPDSAPEPPAESLAPAQPAPVLTPEPTPALVRAPAISVPAAPIATGLTADEPADQRALFRTLKPFIPPKRNLSRLRVNRVEGPTRVDLKTWTLRVDGLVARPLTLTYDDFRRFPATVGLADFYCVEGWGVSGLEWEGVRLASLLEAVEPAGQGKWLNFFTFPEVYRESLSLEQASLPDVLLAYRLGGKPLPEQHGFPLRLVVPGMYGYKSVKWLSRIELIDRRQLGYWERRGWPPDPWIQ